jgi:carbon storage regulator
MLVLSRAIGQSVVLPEIHTTLTILQVLGKRVRVGVDAPAALTVHRNETWEKIRGQALMPPQIQNHGDARINVLWLDRGRTRTSSVEIHSGRVRFKLVHSQDACIHELAQSQPDLVALDLRAVNAPNSVLDYMAQLNHLACVPVILMGKGRLVRNRTHSQPPIVDYLKRPLDTDQLAQGVLALFAYSEWRAAVTAHDSNSERSLSYEPTSSVSALARP